MEMTDLTARIDNYLTATVEIVKSLPLGDATEVVVNTLGVMEIITDNLSEQDGKEFVKWFNDVWKDKLYGAAGIEGILQ